MTNCRCFKLDLYIYVQLFMAACSDYDAKYILHFVVQLKQYNINFFLNFILLIIQRYQQFGVRRIGALAKVMCAVIYGDVEIKLAPAVIR